MEKKTQVLKKVKFKDSIVTKVTLVNMIIFLCACLFSVLAIVLVNVVHHYQKNAKMMEVYISNTVSSVDNMLKDMGRVSLICFSDDKTQEIMQNYHSYPEKKQIESSNYLQQLYTSLIIIRNDIDGIYMFDKEQLIFYQDSRVSSIRQNPGEIEFLDEINKLEETAKDISGCYLLFDELPDFMYYPMREAQEVDHRNSIYLVRPVRSFRPHEVIGYIALLTSSRTVQKVMEQYLESGISYTLLCNGGTVACSQNKELIGTDFSERESELFEKMKDKEGYFLSDYEGNLCLISYETSEYSGLTLITAKPLRDIIMEMKDLLIYCCIIFLLFAVLALICLDRITKKNLSRITEFAEDVGSFDPSNLNQRYTVEKRDEIGQLKLSFNYMMDIINELVVSEYEGKMKLQQAELTEQKLSMMYLKSQINPHFLYNTLDMIRIKAEINKDREVSGMLMQLVTFYRLSTKVDSTWVTLKHEVEMLDAYMRLMCYRYPRLIYHTEINQELLKLEIPNFILQPLVENSVMHGLKNRGYDGTVELKIFGNEKKDLVLQIVDNGMGMPEDMLKQLNQCSESDDWKQDLEDTEEKNDKHIGIINVRSRLKFFYGKDCCMRFANGAHGGLCITIIIREMKEDYEAL